MNPVISFPTVITGTSVGKTKLNVIIRDMPFEVVYL